MAIATARTRVINLRTDEARRTESPERVELWALRAARMP